MANYSRIINKHRADPKPNLSRILDPIERMSETIFSILIVLIFTLAYRALSLLPINNDVLILDDSLTIFRAALGAVIAWGLIDAIMYAIITIFERRDRVRFLKAVNASTTEIAKLEIIAEELDYIFEPITDKNQRFLIYEQVKISLAGMRAKTIQVEKEDLFGAVAVFIAAIVAVIPSLAPLILFRGDLQFALRLSNLFSLLMLFITGYRWGKYSGYKPLLTGLVIMSIALFMVILAISLGG